MTFLTYPFRYMVLALLLAPIASSQSWLEGPCPLSLFLEDPESGTLESEETGILEFELLARSNGSRWVNIYARPYVDEEAASAAELDLEAIYEAFPWLQKSVTDATTIWGGSLGSSMRMLHAPVDAIIGASTYALGIGAAFPLTAVRETHQPTLVDSISGVALDRTWDVACESWVTFSSNTTDRDYWYERLARDPDGVNTTLFDRDLFFESAIEEFVGIDEFRAFQDHPVFSYGKLKNANVVCISLQASCVLPLGVSISGIHDNGVGGLFTPLGTHLPVGFSLSNNAILRPILGIPISGPRPQGGPAYLLNGVAISPRVATSNGTSWLELPMAPITPPLKAKVAINGVTQDLFGEPLAVGWARFPLPSPVHPNDLIQILEIENYGGITDTSELSWSMMIVPFLLPGGQ